MSGCAEEPGAGPSAARRDLCGGGRFTSRPTAMAALASTPVSTLGSSMMHGPMKE
jgi:hypothetical protein